MVKVLIILVIVVPYLLLSYFNGSFDPRKWSI
jgi:hypothetical protein